MSPDLNAIRERQVCRRTRYYHTGLASGERVTVTVGEPGDEDYRTVTGIVGQQYTTSNFGPVFHVDGETFYSYDDQTIVQHDPSADTDISSLIAEIERLRAVIDAGAVRKPPHG